MMPEELREAPSQTEETLTGLWNLNIMKYQEQSMLRGGMAHFEERHSPFQKTESEIAK